MQCCNKHVIIYSGARVSEFIRAIRSFISIDKTTKLKDFVRWQHSLEKNRGERQAHQHASQVHQIWKRVDAHLSLTSIPDAGLIEERWLLQAQKEKTRGTLPSNLGIIIFSLVKYMYF